jgi:hypothetical protein
VPLFPKGERRLVLSLFSCWVMQVETFLKSFV